jgi:hypothetical protein
LDCVCATRKPEEVNDQNSKLQIDKNDAKMHFHLQKLQLDFAPVEFLLDSSHISAFQCISQQCMLSIFTVIKSRMIQCQKLSHAFQISLVGLCLTNFIIDFFSIVSAVDTEDVLTSSEGEDDSSLQAQTRLLILYLLKLCLASLIVCIAVLLCWFAVWRLILRHQRFFQEIFARNNTNNTTVLQKSINSGNNSTRSITDSQIYDPVEAAIRQRKQHQQTRIVFQPPKQIVKLQRKDKSNNAATSADASAKLTSSDISSSPILHQQSPADAVRAMRGVT